MAQRWIERNKPGNQLLRGPDIDNVERWAVRRPKNTPEPTRDHIGFIEASRDASQRRQRAWIAGSMAAAIIALGLSGIAYWQRGLAVENEKIAENRALESRLRAQAAQAQVLLDVDRIGGLELSAKTVRENLSSARQIIPEVYSSVAKALHVTRQSRQLRRGSGVSYGTITRIAVSPDGKTLAVATADLLYLLDRSGGDIAPPIAAPDGRYIFANDVRWDKGGKNIIVASGAFATGKIRNAALRKYTIKGVLNRSYIADHDAPVMSVAIEKNDKYVVAGDARGAHSAISYRATGPGSCAGCCGQFDNWSPDYKQKSLRFIRAIFYAS